MPMDGLTLGFIARELNTRLAGSRIEKIAQPEKDMLVLTVHRAGQNDRLLISASPSFARIHLTGAQYVNPIDAPMFLMLMRKHLLYGRLESIEQVAGDRILALHILAQDELGVPHPYALYYEAMGRHSNLTLTRDGRIVDAIRHVTDDMSRVRQALPGLQYQLPPTQNKLAPSEAEAEALQARLESEAGPLNRALARQVAGLSAISAKELCFRMTGSADTDLKDVDLPSLCVRLSAFLKTLQDRFAPVLLRGGDGALLDVFPFPYLTYPAELQQPQSTLSGAMDRLFEQRDRADRMNQRSAALRKSIRTHLDRCEKKLGILRQDLLDAQNADDLRVCGELINAQLYAIPRGAAQAALIDWYTGGTRTVMLDPALTPSQNAQRYFKRYRKLHAAGQLAGSQIHRTQEEIVLLENALQGLDAAQDELDIAEVRSLLTAAGFVKAAPGSRRAPKDTRKAKPLLFVLPDGSRIHVGKNALQNERLTQGADGEDVWLHAKDMPGSHVILETHGQPFSELALQTALRLAAWYSKGKGQGVPVDYTLRKYVKKPGGTPAGFVTYTHQQTEIVTVSQGELPGAAK